MRAIFASNDLVLLCRECVDFTILCEDVNIEVIFLLLFFFIVKYIQVNEQCNKERRKKVRKTLSCSWNICVRYTKVSQGFYEEFIIFIYVNDRGNGLNVPETFLLLFKL